MPVMLDPGSLILHDCPPEWPTVPQELIEKLIPQPPQPIRDQFGRLHHFNPMPMFTPQQRNVLDQIAASRHFLIKMDENNRCGNCGQRHGYFTLGCVEKPFNGLTEITHAIMGKPWQDFGLSPRERREIDPGMKLDVPWKAVRLGDIQPITALKARFLKEQIRMKGYIIR